MLRNCNTCKNKTVLVSCTERVKQNKDKTHPVFGECDFYINPEVCKLNEL